MIQTKENGLYGKQKTKIFDLLFLLCAVLIACFYPQSINGVMMSVEQTIVYYAICLSLMLVILLLSGKLMIKNVVLSIVLVIYLTIATLVSIQVLDAEFSIARVAAAGMLIILCCSRYNFKISFKIMVNILTAISLIIIIWNIALLMKNDTVFDFTLNYYKQFADFTVFTQINNGKPVFTFGVHTFAAFYYMIFFWLWWTLLRKGYKHKNLCRFFMCAFLFQTLLLKSTTSFVFIIVMYIMLALSFKRITSRLIYIIISLIALVAFLKFNPDIIQGYLNNFFGGENGFLPRYTDNNVFVNNFEVLKKVIVGIGFTIPREYNVYFTDSGYVSFLTMGSLTYLLFAYFCFYKFLKANLPENYIGIFLIVLGFEFASPCLFYIKTLLILVFVVGVLQSFDNSRKINENYNRSSYVK